MNIYLCEQDKKCDYDTYDSFVCVAKSDKEARGIHPAGPLWKWGERYSPWCDNQKDVQVTLIGVADEKLKESGIICSSFNAG